jgi:hypothetical protein
VTQQHTAPAFLVHSPPKLSIHSSEVTVNSNLRTQVHTATTTMVNPAGPIAIFLGAAFVSSIILFVTSWGVLEYTEIGLDYNAITRSIADETYHPGRYWLGIGHMFLKFPSTVQNVMFSDKRGSSGEPLRSRTKDGGREMSNDRFID